MESSRTVLGSRTVRPNPLLKGLAILLLYAFLAHPSAYAGLLREGNWYVLASGAVIVPMLLVWSTRVLMWSVRLGPTTISIKGAGSGIERPYQDVSEVERKPGQLLVVFKDGFRKAIPSIIGNLDELQAEINSRRTGNAQDDPNGGNVT